MNRILPILLAAGLLTGSAKLVSYGGCTSGDKIPAKYRVTTRELRAAQISPDNKYVVAVVIEEWESQSEEDGDGPISATAVYAGKL